MAYTRPGLLIAGEWRFADGGNDAIPVHNPATGEWLADLPIVTDAELDTAIDAAESASARWAATPALQRGRILADAGLRLRGKVGALAEVLTLEQGKTLAESAAELTGAADTFEWMAEEGKRLYGRVVPSRLVGSDYLVLREPVGATAAFTP